MIKGGEIKWIKKFYAEKKSKLLTHVQSHPHFLMFFLSWNSGDIGKLEQTFNL